MVHDCCGGPEGTAGRVPRCHICWKRSRTARRLRCGSEASLRSTFRAVSELTSVRPEAGAGTRPADRGKACCSAVRGFHNEVDPNLKTKMRSTLMPTFGAGCVNEGNGAGLGSSSKQPRHRSHLHSRHRCRRLSFPWCHTDVSELIRSCLALSTHGCAPSCLLC